MSNYIIYGRPGCSKCEMAKAQCFKQGVSYTYKVVGDDVTNEQLNEMIGTPVRSVPQIFVTSGGFSEYIGGYEEFIKHINGGV